MAKGARFKRCHPVGGRSTAGNWQYADDERFYLTRWCDDRWVIETESDLIYDWLNSMQLDWDHTTFSTRSEAAEALALALAANPLAAGTV